MAKIHDYGSKLLRCIFHQLPVQFVDYLRSFMRRKFFYIKQRENGSPHHLQSVNVESFRFGSKVVSMKFCAPKNMKQAGVLASILLACYASAIIINDPSALPSVENANRFISGSTEKAVHSISVSPVLPANEESDVKFGFRQKPTQPHHVVPTFPERRGPVLLPKVDDFSEQKPFVLKHTPSLLPTEGIPLPSAGPIIPVSHVPVVPQQSIIPVTEDRVPVEQTQRIPHKSKHRRSHVPNHRCDCPIPIVPDDTKPQRRHHLLKHTRKTEKKPHISHTNEDKL